MKKEENSSGVASVILGILSISSIIMFPFGWPASIALGITGLVFGIVQMKNSRNKWATSGITLSIIGVILAVIVFIWLLSLANNPELMAQFSQLQSLQGVQAA